LVNTLEASHQSSLLWKPSSDTLFHRWRKTGRLSSAWSSFTSFPSVQTNSPDLVSSGFAGYLSGMKQYRPDVERQKWLYSMEKSRKVLRRWQGKPDGPDPSRPRIPDNSEPWLPGGVRSMADAMWISDRIKETAEQWGLNKPPQS